mmetsp:Transcript_19130/g.56706  ORF Transcript_19130/g.56706 Transcript_19130/m.56706 type:complete len:366 (-) Transcript_19130:228-1325(-)
MSQRCSGASPLRAISTFGRRAGDGGKQKRRPDARRHGLPHPAHCINGGLRSRAARRRRGRDRPVLGLYLRPATPRGGPRAPAGREAPVGVGRLEGRLVRQRLREQVPHDRKRPLRVSGRGSIESVRLEPLRAPSVALEHEQVAVVDARAQTRGHVVSAHVVALLRVSSLSDPHLDDAHQLHQDVALCAARAGAHHGRRLLHERRFARSVSWNFGRGRHRQVRGVFSANTKDLVSERRRVDRALSGVLLSRLGTNELPHDLLRGRDGNQGGPQLLRVVVHDDQTMDERRFPRRRRLRRQDRPGRVPRGIMHDALGRGRAARVGVARGPELLADPSDDGPVAAVQTAGATVSRFDVEQHGRRLPIRT